MALLRSTRIRESFDAITAADAPVVDGDRPATGVISVNGVLYPEELFVTTKVAHAVPAYKRARTLITSSLAQMPLEQYKARTGERGPSVPFLRQPDPNRVRSAFLADILGDLCDYGVAYALNPRWNTAEGWRDANAPNGRKHRSVQYLAAADVLDVDADSYRILVRTPGDADVREADVPAHAVIGFECAAGAWLRDGARVITTARMLEDAARLYASAPMPSTILKNTGPRKTPEQVTELLDALEASRRTRATAYVGRDLELDSMGWDANQIALGEARAHSVLDIARLTGVPSIYLSQGPNDASMMYSNQTQARLDLHSAMMPYATAIAERLSFDDVTGEGNRVEFEFAEWLRVDPTMRANLYAQMIPLGVLTVEEARRMENLVDNSAARQDNARELSIAEVVQKVYLGVGKVLTVDEARAIVNQAGGNLPIPGPENLNPEGTTQ